jgi:hypothetical protein
MDFHRKFLVWLDKMGFITKKPLGDVAMLLLFVQLIYEISPWLARAVWRLPFRLVRPALKRRCGTKVLVLFPSNQKTLPSPLTIWLARVVFGEQMVLFDFWFDKIF